MANINAKLVGKVPSKSAPMEDFLKFYNDNSGSSKQATSKTFKGDTAVAHEKCTELAAAIDAITSSTGTKGKKPKVKGEQTAEGAKGRKSGHAGKTITALKPENPRREGTHGHKSFKIILDAGKKGISYEDYIAAGGRSNDLAWDIDKGNAEVK